MFADAKRPVFDYEDPNSQATRGFRPSSDMDYLKFKAQMKHEWEEVKRKYIRFFLIKRQTYVLN